MTRVKSGPAVRHRHKKVLTYTKGHSGKRHRVFKMAHESMIKALSYSYAHRKERKADFRKLWIARINAAVRVGGVSYSQFMHGLKLAGVKLDRKVLADMAISDPGTFAKLIEVARQGAQS